MIQSLICILILLIPTIGVVAGLSAATTISLFLAMVLFALRYELRFKHFISHRKLEITFLFWCFVTIFYSTNTWYAIATYMQVLVIVLAGLLIHDNIEQTSLDISRIKKYFITGVIIGIILLCLEYLSGGMITITVRSIIQPTLTNIFAWTNLDRGCALLSVISWVILAILIQYRKYVLAIGYYFVILYLLYLSDSLASFVAFIGGGFVFSISRLSMTSTMLKTAFFRLFIIGIFSGSILMPIISYKMQPLNIIEASHSYLPDSAKHRLFIWHFVAEKIVEKPVFGYGWGASKNFPVEENEMIRYRGEEIWSPLPLHPHNNVIQVIFETGIIGFCLFILLIYKNLLLVYMAKNDTIGADCKSIYYACFTNYYIIGMISFSIWQAWWVSVAILAACLMRLFVRQT